MPKGYWMANVLVTDKDMYAKYAAANKKAFDKYGARFLARGGRCEDLDNAGWPRNVIIEFDSYEQALACYNSPEYQEAVKFRKAGSKGHTIIVEGVE